MLAVAVVLLLVYLVPYFHMVLTSLKPRTEVFEVPPTFIPSPFTLESYYRMGSYLPIFKYIGNSVVVAGASTLLAVFFGSMAAYGISRLTSALTNVLFMVALTARMIPLVTVSIPILLIIRDMGLLDTHLGLILVYAAINMPFVIWMMAGFFDGIPRDLEESALVDGAGNLQSFLRIVLPISAPGLATTTIFVFITAWNEFLFALLLTRVDAKTAPVGISEFLTVYGVEWGPMTAAATVFTLPVLILSVFVQRRIVSGMTLGAVRG